MQREQWVLIVDDDEDTRESIADALELEGYRSRMASNGQEALHVLREFGAPLAILLDLSMPVMDGYEFRAAQQSDPKLASIPVIVSSGERTVRMQELGAVTLLGKPLDLSKLIAALTASAARVKA